MKGWIAWALLVVALLTFLSAMLQGYLWFVVVAMLALLAAVLLACLHRVDHGYVAVIRRWDRSVALAKGPLVWVTPVWEQYESQFLVGVRFARITAKDVQTHSAVPLDVHASIFYTIDLTRLDSVRLARMAGMSETEWDSIVTDWFDKVIRLVIDSTPSNKATLHDRQHLQAAVQRRLQQEMMAFGIHIVDIWLHEVKPPAAYQAAAIHRETMTLEAEARSQLYNALLTVFGNASPNRVHELAELLIAEGMQSNGHSPLTLLDWRMNPYAGSGQAVQGGSATPPPGYGPATSNGYGSVSPNGQAGQRYVK